MLCLIGLGLILREAASVAHLPDPVLTSPTRIFARTPVLTIGQETDRAFVEAYLERLGYTADTDRRVGPGEFRLESRRWVIGRRAFRHGFAVNPPGTIVARLGFGGRIARLEDESGRRLRRASLEPEPIGLIEAPTGARSADGSREDRLPVRLSSVPHQLIDAVLTIEDQRFYEHQGLDYRRIGGAAWANLRALRVVQGGSTLTQQLAKSLYLSPRRSLIRKMREAAIARRLERRHTKDEILEAYLNEIYMGQSGAIAIHGMGRAARHYFGVDITELDLPRAALLAGLIRGPSLYSPFRRPETATDRRNLVLAMMRERGLISEAEQAEAREAPLGLGRAPRPLTGPRYFLDHLTRSLEKDSELGAAGSGLAIFSTVDMRLQRAAESAITRTLASLESRLPAASGSGRTAEEVGRPEAALVALDPRTGEILAMVGGRDYGTSQYNRAVSARRQPGSAFKPIVALAALAESEHSLTLATLLDDERLEIETPQGPWRPVNYTGEFRGPVTLREALEQSLNVPFARLGLAIGPERVVATAQRLGIETPLLAVPSIALGSSEVSLLELTRAYGVLAAGGYRADSKAWLGILDAEGEITAQARVTGSRAFGAAESYLVTSALEGVAERGTGRSLRELGYAGPVAAKSGTTNSFRDAWFVAYTPTLAVGVWVGFDDGGGLGLTGSRAALPIVARFLIDAVGPEGMTGPYGSHGFEAPQGLEMGRVPIMAGGFDGCRSEIFLTGTVPVSECWRSDRLRYYDRFDRSRRSGNRAWDREASRLQALLNQISEREARIESERRSGRRSGTRVPDDR